MLGSPAGSNSVTTTASRACTTADSRSWTRLSTLVPPIGRSMSPRATDANGPTGLVTERALHGHVGPDVRLVPGLAHALKAGTLVEGDRGQPGVAPHQAATLGDDVVDGRVEDSGADAA